MAPLALNFDIISLILDLLLRNHDGSIDRNSLAVASGIGQQWRNPAQSRLFETVEIHSKQTLNAFIRSTPTSSKRGRQLRAMVIHLSIFISGHSAVLGIAPSQSLTERDFLTLLPTLPNLYVLVVISVAPSISRAGQKALAALKSPRIRSLVVRYVGEPPDRQHQILFNFLTSLPPLERVMFIGKGTYLFPSSLPGRATVLPSPQLSLKGLRLDLRHSQPSLKGSDLAWLIGHSPTTLTILHLYDLILDPSMGPRILSIAPQLQSFHVSSSRRFDLRDLQVWVEHMENLKELVVRNDIRSANDCFRVITDLPSVMKALPGTMQHLGLSVDSQSALEAVKAEVKEWSTRCGAILDVLTLVVTSTKPLDQWIHTTNIAHVRLFHHTDKDVIFSFLTPLLPTERFPRYVQATLRGKLALGEEGEERRRSFSPVGLFQQLLKG
ncbi:hypothetical protein M408DRAFT_5514 [Serendipita vermifera MAFF 305830]|uniref:F-box domain-containing protein n=1 Tax=Serendipita vermifera MAFF 305830 TaxID=933852 RepID=A0A0C3BQ38_SERVB|nr:hypothetical protein M408DRAFT_5514 [Serendipita vermifera MAFF 305830]